MSVSYDLPILVLDTDVAIMLELDVQGTTVLKEGPVNPRERISARWLASGVLLDRLGRQDA
jgi:hypothetical protein